MYSFLHSLVSRRLIVTALFTAALSACGPMETAADAESSDLSGADEGAPTAEVQSSPPDAEITQPDGWVSPDGSVSPDGPDDVYQFEPEPDASEPEAPISIGIPTFNDPFCTYHCMRRYGPRGSTGSGLYVGCATLWKADLSINVYCGYIRP